MTNRLESETSPYLIQHAENPVDWFPWGDEALKRAEAEDKPIFLSIGYSACHWCHVMERESFEDPETAELMNRDFINIKVDREERPDLDSIYMESVMTMTGHGGWPMSVFLTPRRVPFFGGTYFPPEPRYRMPSFREVLTMVADAFRDRRGHLEQTSERLLAALQADERQRGGAISPALLASAQASLAAGYDDLNGGWGGAPKFPQPMAIEFLLRRYVRTGDSSALAMATNTLEKMARGGIYDHLGGGFHRYATDSIWLVPHFEKMLYDNSQLARVYLKAWQMTGEPLFRRVVEETLDYVIHEMTNPEGGFYSTLDADSEGEEGKYYVWEPSEVRDVLGDDAEALMKAYDVSENGNFEGRNILNRPLDFDVVAHLLDTTTSELDERLAVSKKALFERRARRIKPGLDDKVLTSWNGLMLAAFAEAARAFDNPDYLTAARRNARFVLSELRTPEGRLLRTWKDGRASLNGYLEDYSYLLEGLLALYQATFESEWFAAAREIADVMIERFADPQGGFFDTSDDHERLITRPKNVQDNATPSGSAMAATALFRLSGLTGDGRYAEAAESGMNLISGFADKHPTAFGQWLNAMDYCLGDPLEVAIVGDPASRDSRELLDVVFEGFRPGVVVAAGEEADISPVPLLSRRPRIDRRATAYVCRNFACNLPVTRADDLRSQL